MCFRWRGIFLPTLHLFLNLNICHRFTLKLWGPARCILINIDLRSLVTFNWKYKHTFYSATVWLGTRPIYPLELLQFFVVFLNPPRKIIIFYFEPSCSRSSKSFPMHSSWIILPFVYIQTELPVVRNLSEIVYDLKCATWKIYDITLLTITSNTVALNLLVSLCVCVWVYACVRCVFGGGESGT